DGHAIAVHDVLERRQRAVQHRHAGLVGVHRVVDPLRRRPIDGAGERDVNRLEDTPLDGEQMGREDEVTRESALPREGGPQLREVTVLVSRRVGAEVLGHLTEQEVPLERPARARDARRGVDHHLPGLVDQPFPSERERGEQRRGRVTTGVRHEVRRRDLGTGDLGQAVHRVGGQAEVGGQIHRALAQAASLLHVARRHAVRQGRQHDFGPREGRILDPDEGDAVTPLARGRLGRRERDRGTRMTGEESQQLLPHVAGGPEHADWHPCINIHRYGKIFTLARSARPGLASRMIAKLIPTLAGLALVPALGAQAPTAASRSAPPRPFSLDDVLHVRDVRDPEISPDGAWVTYTVSTPEDADTAKPKTPAPIVIDRFQFKQDEGGYLGKQRRHLYVLDVESGKTTMLTSGDYDELLPAWSPDGKSLVFVSKRRPDADRDSNWDLYVMDAAPRGSAAPRQLTMFEGPDNDPDTESRPAWSPDGRSIAYLQGGPLKLIYYAVQKLAVV